MTTLLAAVTKVVKEMSDRAHDMPLRLLRLYRADVRQAHRDVGTWSRRVTAFAKHSVAKTRAAMAAETAAASAAGARRLVSQLSCTQGPASEVLPYSVCDYRLHAQRCRSACVNAHLCE